MKTFQSTAVAVLSALIASVAFAQSQDMKAFAQQFGESAKANAAGLRYRGKRGGVIACALANRANRIAYALVRDQQSYDPTRWTMPVPASQPARQEA